MRCSVRPGCVPAPRGTRSKGSQQSRRSPPSDTGRPAPRPCAPWCSRSVGSRSSRRGRRNEKCEYVLAVGWTRDDARHAVSCRDPHRPMRPTHPSAAVTLAVDPWTNPSGRQVLGCLVVSSSRHDGSHEVHALGADPVEKSGTVDYIAESLEGPMRMCVTGPALDGATRRGSIRHSTAVALWRELQGVSLPSSQARARWRSRHRDRHGWGRQLPCGAPHHQGAFLGHRDPGLHGARDEFDRSRIPARG